MHHLNDTAALTLVALLVASGCATSTPRESRDASPYTVKAPARPAPEQAAAACRDDAPAQTWAVVVGINTYQDDGIADLQGAVGDAWSFYHYLASPEGARVAPERLTLLLNDEATRDRVMGTLGNFVSSACPQDQVFIYFAGHGIIEPGREDSAFLLMHDSQMDNLVGTAVSMLELPDFLQRRAGNVGSLLMLIDACHAGYVRFPGQRGAGPEAGDRITLFNEALTENVTRSRSWGAISATTSDQFSFESTKGWRSCQFDNYTYQGGLFTCHLIRGLAGEADDDKDGQIQLGELARHVNQRVVQDSLGIQIPQLSGQLDTRRVLTRTPRHAIPIPHIPEKYLTPEPERPLRPWLWAGAGLTAASAAAGLVFYRQEARVTEDINVGRRDNDYDDAIAERDTWVLSKTASLSVASVVGAMTLVGLVYELSDQPQDIEDVYELPPLFRIDLDPTTPNGGINATLQLEWD